MRLPHITLSGIGKAVVFVAALIALHYLLGDAIRALAHELIPDDPAALRSGLWVTCAAYALLLALPFVPGIEIGLALLAMIGPSVVPHVYLATVAGLSMAYLAGRLVPVAVLTRLTAALRMRRTAELLRQVSGLDHAQRLDYLLENAPNRLLPALIRNRHLALAALLNLPGNALIGGGGGIALIVGMSRLIAPGGFLATVALAVSPVPILFYFFGIGLAAP